MAKKNNKEQKAKPKKRNIKYLGGLLFGRMARAGARELCTNAERVNNLNVFPVPDGDTGDNMRLTIESGIAAIENLNTDNLADVMRALSHGMLLGARGNSGVILSQFFLGTAKGLATSKKADPRTLADALSVGVKQAYSSVSTPAEGTILTVAREAVEYAQKRITEKSTIRSFFLDLVCEMEKSLKRTPEALSVLKNAGVVDSGGAGLFYIMDGFYSVLNGEEIAENAEIKDTPARENSIKGHDNSDNTVLADFGYCTEMLINLNDKDSLNLDKLKGELCDMGDSLALIFDEDILKVHIHTSKPERALEHCHTLGEFLKIKIENMSLQHSELIAKTEVRGQRKKYGAVAVGTGEGVEKLFYELGADCVIDAEKNNIPSTKDFLDSYAKINAEDIIVFPNNSNIIMAAQQSAQIYKESSVHVIKTSDIGSGYIALSSMDYESDSLDALINSIDISINNAVSGLISKSAKDTEKDGFDIKKDDIIGIVDKKIICSSIDFTKVCEQLCDYIINEKGKRLISVFIGKEGEEKNTEKIKKYVEDKNLGVELYFIFGGQDIYPYIFVGE